MAESTRYKILMCLVWLQIVIIPITLLMIEYTGPDRVWRWNVPFRTLLIGYSLGYLLLPFSRGLEKSGILKWWLRIDLILSILMFIPFYFTLLGCQITSISTKENYVLYNQAGGLAGTPHVSLGIKSGLFIKNINNFTIPFWTISDNDWVIDNTKGYMFLQTKVDQYAEPRLFVSPIDSSVYHVNDHNIREKIDSLYYGFQKHYDEMEFVMPDDFSRISYSDSSSISYYKSDEVWHPSVEIIYTTVAGKEYPDSVIIRIEGQRDCIMYHKDSIPPVSPTELQRFFKRIVMGKR